MEVIDKVWLHQNVILLLWQSYTKMAIFNSLKLGDIIARVFTH